MKKKLPPTQAQMGAWISIQNGEKDSEKNRNQAFLFRQRLTEHLKEEGISIDLTNTRSPLEQEKLATVRRYVERQLRALPDLIEALKRLESNAIHVVTAHTICEISLFDHLQAMQEEGVVSNFSLVTEGTKIAVQELELGRTDVSFFNRDSVDESRLIDKGFTIVPYGDFPFELVLPKSDDSALTKATVRTKRDGEELLKHLCKYTRLVLSPLTTRSRIHIEAKLKEFDLKIEPSNVISLDSTTAMLNAVHRGIGYAITWRPVLEKEAHFDVSRISLAPVLGSWRVGFGYSTKGASAVVRNLVGRLARDFTKTC